MPRALAGAAAAALIAGCGSSTVSGSARTQSASGSRSSGGVSAAQSGAAGGVAAGQLASGVSGGGTTAAGTIGSARQTPLGHANQSVTVSPITLGSASAGSVSAATAGSGRVSLPDHGIRGRSGAARAATRQTTKATGGAGTRAGGGTGTGNAAPGAAEATPAPSRERARKHSSGASRTRTVTVVRVRTVVRTRRPDVPSEAFLPSRHPALAMATFTVSGGNIGCTVARRAVRCVIERRVWAPPLQPAGCRASWGDAIALGAKAPASFACGGRAVVAPNAKVIPDGWDDTFGGMTCQVRGIGVGCFSATHHGFFVSRTGYALY